MRYLLLVLIFTATLFSGVLKSTILSVNEEKAEVTIKINNIDIGVNGFVYHTIEGEHNMILNNAVVKKFDKNTNIATLGISEYNALRNNALPSGKWKTQVGDKVILAFGYTRGLLISPSEEIYYRITRHSKLQWVHPDIFATILSFNGHPTPLREDFTKLSIASSVGLIYIFLDKQLYTIDSKSFKILTVIEADLLQDETNLPFYTRVPEIDANWFGEGSNELEYYEAYYYKLLAEANSNNKTLYDIIKAKDQKLKNENAEDSDRYQDALEFFGNDG